MEESQFPGVNCQTLVLRQGIVTRVGIEMETPYGRQLYSFAPDDAQKVVEGLVEAIRQARTGIVISKGLNTDPGWPRAN